MADKEIRRKKLRIWGVFFGIMLSVLLAGITMKIIKNTGLYPRGYDVMYHIYRGESLFQALKNQEWYPLYDRYLYNGVQPLRYWAPMSVYLLAILRFVKDSILDAYLLFIGMLIILSVTGWLRFGWRFQRMPLAIFTGLLWFFMPENLRVLFGSGNMPRGLVAALLPWFMFSVISFLDYSKKLKEYRKDTDSQAGFDKLADTGNHADTEYKMLCRKRAMAFVGIGMQTMLLVLAHSGQASIVLLCLLLFLLCYCIQQRQVKAALQVIFAAVGGYALTGLWLYPSLKGGLVSMGNGSSQVMQDSFQSGFLSLQPLERLQNLDIMYFGLSILFLAVMGCFLGFREQRAGFLAGILIFLGTTASAYHVLMRLPFSSILWMDRFVSVALIFVLISFLQWKRLRPVLAVLMCVCLTLDVLPSLGYLWVPKEERKADAAQKIEDDAQRLLLNDAKAVTQQRIAMMDLSAYTAFAPYYLAGKEPAVLCTFGAAWQSAHTASNIVKLNTAVTEGYYEYLFDRCLEMGNDTVYILESVLKNGKKDMEQLTKAAQSQGYEFVKDNGIDAIFHKSIAGSFGVVSRYPAIAIGSSAQEIALRYPVFQETDEGNLNTYTFEELSQYEKIYLSGFTYDDKSKAEELLRQLARFGCEIYVDMSRIPAESAGLSEFLGYQTTGITLEKYFPVLAYKGKEYSLGEFPKEYSSWNTVYLIDESVSDGKTSYNGQNLSFSSSIENDNIHLLGFNLLYYTLKTQDKSAGTLMDNYFQAEAGKLPERSMVPVSIVYSPKGITIETEYDQVNTTLAYLDSFSIDRKVTEENHLLVVNSGVTQITFTYPYFAEGLFISLAGVLFLIGYGIWLSQKKCGKNAKKP